MEKRTAHFWETQIQAAKTERADYFRHAKEAAEAYTKGCSYNILFSNIQTLKANLLTNTPKPYVERRFIKKAVSQKELYNTFLEVSKITEAALIYFTDTLCLQEKFKTLIEIAKKTGQAVAWVEYNPVITSKIVEGKEAEEITDYKIDVAILGYRDYLSSSAESPEGVWWKARRHCFTKKELLEKFDYEADDADFSLSNKGGTERKLAEVWEIWDKAAKKRYYILAQSAKKEILKETDDPYLLEQFFPTVDLTPLMKEDSVIPVPEYVLYKKKADHLNAISALGDNLEDNIKYIITTDVANQDNAASISTGDEGEVITLNINPALGVDAKTVVNTVPIAPAVELANHRQAKKADLKVDIWEITGIGDLMRGISDPNETAAAQKIKGVFGSLRFQDQQKDVQAIIVKIYRIIAELICEHFSAKVLSEITSTYLPSEEEKAFIRQRMAQLQGLQAAGIAAEPITKEEKDILEQPSWEQVLSIMRSEKLRNYTIDVQSTATVFDDLGAQNESIAALNLAYKDIVNTAVQFNNPTIIRGFIPIAKMQLTNIKSGQVLSKQLLETLETAADELERKLAESAGQVPPQVQAQQQELAIRAQEAAGRIEAEKIRAQADLILAQTKQGELALKEKELLLKAELDRAELPFKQQLEADKVAQLVRENDIRQQEANRKDAELEAQLELKMAQIQSGVAGVNPNIPGEVGPL